MKKLFSLLCVAAAAAGMSLSAETIFFTVNGAGTMDGTSWENAKPGSQLRASFNPAQPGDMICIGAGEYKISPSITMGKQGVVVRGGYPATMTGTDTEIEYPSAEQTIIKPNGNTTAPLFALKPNLESFDNVAPIVFSGITFSGYKQTTTTTYQGTIFYVQRGVIEFDHLYFEGNQYTAANGAIIEVRGSKFWAHDCIWRNNLTKNAGNAIRFSGVGDYKNTAMLDRCEFVDNQMIAPESAGYGGVIAFADNDGTLYVNNCTAKGTTLNYGGGFIRCGGNTVTYFTNNTIFDMHALRVQSVNANGSMGQAISVGTGAKAYMANNIVVNDEIQEHAFDGEVYIQTTGSELISGGYNLFGKVTLKDANAKYTNGDNDATNLTIADVFGANEIDAFAMRINAESDHHFIQVLSPLSSLAGVPLSEIIALMEAWNMPGELNLAVDQTGCKRAATTTPGAFDVNVEHEITTSVESISVPTTTIEALGGNAYRAADAVVYDLQGRMVSRANAAGIVDLTPAQQGMYIIRAGEKAVKVIR